MGFSSRAKSEEGSMGRAVLKLNEAIISDVLKLVVLLIFY